MKYRPDIDGLRALAVLAVLIFHVEPTVLPGGFIGVDIFFVISGYLITIILWNSFPSPSFSFLSFYARRSHRLLPALYATIVFTLFTALAWFPLADVRTTAVSAVSAVLSLSNVRFSLQAGYFDVSVLRKPLLHTWSLAVEEQFYLLWPIILKAVHSHRNRFSRVLVFPIIVALAVFSEYFTRHYPSLAYFLAPFRFYEFMIGAALHLYAPSQSFIVQEILSITGMLGILYSLVAFSGSTSFPGFSALLPTVATALLIQAPRSCIAQALSFPLLTKIGRISYSVYLVHWPLIVAFRLVSARELIPEEAVFLGLSSVALGYGLHHAVEKRFRSTKSSEESSSRQSCYSLLNFAALGLIVCVGAYWTTSLAKFKFDRIRSSQSPNSLASKKVIDGVNITAIRMWAKRMSSETDRDWVRTFIYQDKVKVPKFQSWGAKYKPPAPRARMLLIGDSHAGRLLPMFTRIAVERGFDFTMMTSTGCPSLFGCKKIYTSKVMKGGTEACVRQQKFWEKHVKENAYDFVALSSRWMWHFEGSTYGKHWVKQEMIVDENGNIPKSVPDRRRLFQKFFRRTVQSVAATGAHVILLSQAPNIGKEIKGCLELGSAKKALQLGIQPKECLGEPRTSSMQRLRFLDGLVSQLGYQDERVTSVLPSKYFCDNWEDSHCRSIYDKTELYMDSTHVSNFGSIFLGQRWMEDSYSGLDWTYRNPKLRNGSKTLAP